MEDEIRELAYYIWEDCGRTEGRDVEIWLAAERFLRERSTAMRQRRFDLVDEALKIAMESIVKKEDTKVFEELNKRARLDAVLDIDIGTDGNLDGWVAVPKKKKWWQFWG